MGRLFCMTSIQVAQVGGPQICRVGLPTMLTINLAGTPFIGATIEHAPLRRLIAWLRRTLRSRGISGGLRLILSAGSWRRAQSGFRNIWALNLRCWAHEADSMALQC